jgi:ergothioneine biosynthesis protein EgtB
MINKHHVLLSKYKDIREHSAFLCLPLSIEDYGAQPILDASPPKWHLAHTTWFFETFILAPHCQGYDLFNPSFGFLFNSYYESFGDRVKRANRGHLTRPTVEEIYDYRQYVDHKISEFLANNRLDSHILELVEMGLQHEQQHQELLQADIKYILGTNPLFPAYSNGEESKKTDPAKAQFIEISEGLYPIGFEGPGFCFDHEKGCHKTYLHPFEISSSLVTNGEYLEFIQDKGYEKHGLWHEEGWTFINHNNIRAPLYWHFIDGQWHHYTSRGLQKIEHNDSLCHISFYEAYAYAEWKQLRLPTEFEWEVAASKLSWGMRWEWTQSAFLPYPGFRKEPGALGEYNGKFMINQMVLRGASEATPVSHRRLTYRNFFHPHIRNQFTGIRLAQ